jgi:hypothetical protein
MVITAGNKDNDGAEASDNYFVQRIFHDQLFVRNLLASSHSSWPCSFKDIPIKGKSKVGF